MVYGSRFIGETHRVLYFWHSVGNRLLTLMSNLFTDLNLTDMETCYKVFRREVLQGITLKSNRFGFEPEITAKIARKQAGAWRIYEIADQLLRPHLRGGQEDRPQGRHQRLLLHPPFPLFRLSAIISPGRAKIASFRKCTQSRAESTR